MFFASRFSTSGTASLAVPHVCPIGRAPYSWKSALYTICSRPCLTASPFVAYSAFLDASQGGGRTHSISSPPPFRIRPPPRRPYAPSRPLPVTSTSFPRPPWSSFHSSYPSFRPSPHLQPRHTLLDCTFRPRPAASMHIRHHAPPLPLASGRRRPRNVAIDASDLRPRIIAPRLSAAP